MKYEVNIIFGYKIFDKVYLGINYFLILVYTYFICHKITNLIGHNYNVLTRSSPIYNFTTIIYKLIPKFERRKESKNSKNVRERKKVKRRVRIVNIIDNNTMIEWIWIC